MQVFRVFIQFGFTVEGSPFVPVVVLHVFPYSGGQWKDVYIVGRIEFVPLNTCVISQRNLQSSYGSQRVGSIQDIIVVAMYFLCTV